METSRTIRVGTRDYIIHAATVSHAHVLVCVTRGVTRPEHDMVLVLALNLTCYVNSRQALDIIPV